MAESLSKQAIYGDFITYSDYPDGCLVNSAVWESCALSSAYNGSDDNSACNGCSDLNADQAGDSAVSRFAKHLVESAGDLPVFADLHHVTVQG